MNPSDNEDRTEMNVHFIVSVMRCWWAVNAGFSESQEAYNPYPNALLSMRYINHVGKMVIGDCNTEAGEVKEGDNIQTQVLWGLQWHREITYTVLQLVQ